MFFVSVFVSVIIVLSIIFSALFFLFKMACVCVFPYNLEFFSFLVLSGIITGIHCVARFGTLNVFIILVIHEVCMSFCIYVFSSVSFLIRLEIFDLLVRFTLSYFLGSSCNWDESFLFRIACY